MGNWRLARSEEPRALTREALAALRQGQGAGLSRRQLLRRSIGAGFGLWLLEVMGGTLGFLFPNLAGGFGGRIELGSIDEVGANVQVDAGFREGAPAYFQAARTYVQLIDPAAGFRDGDSPDGEGTTTNVMTLWQKCPHLGCKPNFCTTNFWFECPCHGSRYDRLGVKIAELGPAPRGMDRFAHVVQNGRLIVDTQKIAKGPLPIPQGQPGIIPAKSPTGCI
jgi:cytochrome b6-f complex iron-sulfur subunit